MTGRAQIRASAFKHAALAEDEWATSATLVSAGKMVSFGESVAELSVAPAVARGSDDLLPAS